MQEKYGFVSEVFEFYAAAIASVDEFTMTVRVATRCSCVFEVDRAEPWFL